MGPLCIQQRAELWGNPAGPPTTGCLQNSTVGEYKTSHPAQGIMSGSDQLVFIIKHAYTKVH